MHAASLKACGLAMLYAFLTGASMSAQGTPPVSSKAADGTPLVFVVNRKNPVETLSLADLRKMLLGERSHWQDGNRVTVVMREPGNAERDAVIRLVCRLNDRDYTRMVLRSVFTGELRNAPKLLDTSAGVIRFVYNVPGGIGYLRGSEVDDSVKIVQISDASTESAFGFRLQRP